MGRAHRAAIRGRQLRKAGVVSGGHRRARATDDERRLKHRQSSDLVAQPLRRLERQHRAGTQAIQHCRSAEGVDQGVNILDLSVDRKRRRVARITAPAAVVGDHREVWG